MPPRRRQSARGRPHPISPDSRSDARRVGERSIVDEVNPTPASLPLAGGDSSLHRSHAQPRLARLRHGDHAVVATPVIAGPFDGTQGRGQTVPLHAIRAGFTTLAVVWRAESEGPSRGASAGCWR